MFSQKLWRVLRDRPSTDRMKKVLLPDYTPPNGLFSARTSLLMMGWIGLCIFSPYLIIAVSITLFSLRLAWKMTNALTSHHELGRHDMLAVTQLGEMGSAWIIGSAYYVPIASFASNALILCMVLSTMALPLLGIFTLAAIPLGFFTMFILAAAVRFDFRQMMVASFLVSILASTQKNIEVARMWALGSCLAIQVAGYSVFVMVLFLFLINFNLNGEVWIQYALLWFAFVTATLALFAVREIIIFGLQHRLQSSFTDDLFYVQG